METDSIPVYCVCSGISVIQIESARNPAPLDLFILTEICWVTA